MKRHDSACYSVESRYLMPRAIAALVAAKLLAAGARVLSRNNKTIQTDGGWTELNPDVDLVSS